MIDFKSYTKSLTRKYKYKISGNGASYVANPRHTFATFKVELADMSITNLCVTFKMYIP